MQRPNRKGLSSWISTFDNPVNSGLTSASLKTLWGIEFFMVKRKTIRSADGAVLLARIMLIWLFILFGWPKLTGFGGTEAYMAHVGAPFPLLAAIIAVGMEFFAGLAILIGMLTRPLALLFFIYTLGTALIGHHYWTMTGQAQHQNEINFYKNISIMGGFLLLYVTGAGKYSVDSLFQKSTRAQF